MGPEAAAARWVAAPAEGAARWVAARPWEAAREVRPWEAAPEVRRWAARGRSRGVLRSDPAGRRRGEARRDRACRRGVHRVRAWAGAGRPFSKATSRGSRGRAADRRDRMRLRWTTAATSRTVTTRARRRSRPLPARQATSGMRRPTGTCQPRRRCRRAFPTTSPRAIFTTPPFGAIRRLEAGTRGTRAPTLSAAARQAGFRRAGFRLAETCQVEMSRRARRFRGRAGSRTFRRRRGARIRRRPFRRRGIRRAGAAMRRGPTVMSSLTVLSIPTVLRGPAVLRDPRVLRDPAAWLAPVTRPVPETRRAPEMRLGRRQAFRRPTRRRLGAPRVKS